MRWWNSPRLHWLLAKLSMQSSCTVVWHHTHLKGLGGRNVHSKLQYCNCIKNTHIIHAAVRSSGGRVQHRQSHYREQQSTITSYWRRITVEFSSNGFCVRLEVFCTVWFIHQTAEPSQGWSTVTVLQQHTHFIDTCMLVIHTIIHQLSLRSEEKNCSDVSLTKFWSNLSLKQ